MDACCTARFLLCPAVAPPRTIAKVMHQSELLQLPEKFTILIFLPDAKRFSEPPTSANPVPDPNNSLIPAQLLPKGPAVPAFKVVHVLIFILNF